MTETPAPPASALARRWRELQALHDRVDAAVERALQPAHGLSGRELRLLEVLAEQGDGPDGHLQMTALAAAVGLSQSATTRLVDRLESRGLVTRFICVADRRGVSSDATAAGLALLGAATATRDAVLAAELSPAERKRGTCGG